MGAANGAISGNVKLEPRGHGGSKVLFRFRLVHVLVCLGEKAERGLGFAFDFDFDGAA